MPCTLWQFLSAAAVSLYLSFGTIVLAAAFVVCISFGSGHAHLDELASHVRADKVLGFDITVEGRFECYGGVLGYGDGLEAPVWEEDTLLVSTRVHPSLWMVYLIGLER